MTRTINGVEMPPNVHFKHGAFYYVKYGRWHYLGKDLERLPAIMEMVGTRTQHKFYGVEQFIRDRVWPRARSNAIGRRRLSFDLTADEAVALADSAGWRCAVSGTPFSLEEIGPRKQRPYAPSVDRIDSSQGYYKDNCRIVCFAVNYALNAWGADVFYTIARHNKTNIKRLLLDTSNTLHRK